MRLPLSLFLVLVWVLAACTSPAVNGTGSGAERDDASDYDISNQPEARAEIVEPRDGASVTSPVQVEMSTEGVEIVPAGAPAVGEGHFHLLIDVGCVEVGQFIPGPSEQAQADGYHHFGDGSTVAELELEPGTYTLCLQLGDGVHAAFGDPDVIEVTVTEDAQVGK